MGEWGSGGVGEWGSGGVGEWGSGRVFRVKIAKKTPKKAKISTIQPISNDLNVEGQPHMMTSNGHLNNMMTSATP